MCILYAPQGQRDSYCTAIAGVLLKHTKWSVHEIDEFIYNLAIASNDNESEARRSKGTTGKDAKKNLGMPKLAEIVGCPTKAIAELLISLGVSEDHIKVLTCEVDWDTPSNSSITISQSIQTFQSCPLSL